MIGAICEGVVPALLRQIYVGRRSGWLRLVRGDERQSLRFRHGHIVNAHTNVVEERLGETMVRHGLLSQADLDRATEIVIREKRRLGEVLTELGLVDAGGIEDAVATHIHEMLTKVFSWPDGRYEFEPEGDTPAGEITLRLSTGELILEAVRAIRDPEVLREALGDPEGVLAPSSDPLLRFQKLTLSPADGFVLSRVDGTTSAYEIAQLIPLSAEEVERSLLGLLSTGVIEYVPRLRRPRPEGAPRPDEPKATAPAQGEAPPSPPETPPFTPQATPAVPASAPAASRASEASGESAAERRQEILGAAERLQTQNHFEVLGLSRSAGETEVKEAYFRLARRFHPDVHHDASLADLHDQLEAVFIRLGEAYEVLRDPRRRGEYEERLGRPRATAESRAATPATGTPATAREAQKPADPEAEARAAAEALRRASAHFEKEQYWDAIQLLEANLEALDSRSRTRARLLLARCYLKNPNWARRAEEVLLGATRDDPAAAEAWAELGGIYEEKGMRARALSMYRKVLELKPEHEQAARFLAAQAASAPPAEEDSGGLLKKLFRKP